MGVLYGITANERLEKGEPKPIEVYGPTGLRFEIKFILLNYELKEHI